VGRIAPDELEQLKSRIALQRLAERRGVKLRRHGKDLLGLCPFHEDKSPSLVISPEQNLWHCLGACQAGGSVIDWVMRAEGVSFRHAVQLLRADLPALDAEPPRRGGRQQGSVAKHSTVQKLPTPMARNAAAEVLLRQLVDDYHETLKQSPEALAYLEQRGLGSGELIERFRLGFANRTLGYRLPHKNRQAGAELRGQLQRLGVLRPSGHEHFNGSVVMRVMDQQGRVTELYGRKITSQLRAGTPLHLYLRAAAGGQNPRRGNHSSEAQQVISQPDVRAPLGVRDRAVLETFYSTGIRRMESLNLSVFDLDAERGTLMVRQGKGKKDRMVPIGERATLWLERYQSEVRPELVMPPDDNVLLLTHLGDPFTPHGMTALVRCYVEAAELGKRGACHLFRHTMATVMLENGADIRFIQEMLGHVKPETTQIYTQVSIRRLKQIHEATHPSAKLGRRADGAGRPSPLPMAGALGAAGEQLRLPFATDSALGGGSPTPADPGAAAEQLFLQLAAEEDCDDEEDGDGQGRTLPAP
jgi:integrase